MAIFKKVAKFLLGGVVGGLLGLGGKKKAEAQPQALPTATRDDAAAEQARQDAWRQRRGNAADMIVNGSAGAEASGRGGRLVIGN